MLLSCVTISFWSRASSHMQIKPTGELQGKWDSVVATYFVLFLLPNGLITGSNCLDGTHCMSAWLGSLFAVHLSLVCNPAATYACLSVFFSQTLFRTHIYFCLCTFLPIPLSCWFSLSPLHLSVRCWPQNVAHCAFDEVHSNGVSSDFTVTPMLKNSSICPESLW